MSNQSLIRIVDDDEAIIEGLVFLLESEGWNVRTYSSAREFLVNDTPSTPGCLILDVKMPEMSGLELQSVMKERGYCLPIIFLTGHGNIDMAVSTIKAGAVEFLQKTEVNTRLLEAVSKAVALSDKGFSSVDMDPFEMNKRWLTLTEREEEIMRQISLGKLNREIAARLGISVRTVETHRAGAFRKLGVKTTAELTTLISTVDGN